MTDVALSPGQYRTLERLTTPHSSQTSRITELRTALSTVTRRTTDAHYTVKLTNAQILAADYVLRVAALHGGDAEEEYHRFHARYASTLRPDNPDQTGHLAN
ncbi:hypothetical protein [Streptomyces sp. PT19]|uniref:hypothetical protein n=1 Tax=Streptomyces sp. PT19 TaxID=3452239 RepID=UPI003F7DBEDA